MQDKEFFHFPMPVVLKLQPFLSRFVCSASETFHMIFLAAFSSSTYAPYRLAQPITRTLKYHMTIF